jgi:hypothetical protein
MRFILFSAVLLSLSACATTPQATVPRTSLTPTSVHRAAQSFHDESRPVTDGFAVDVLGSKYYFDKTARVSSKKSTTGEELLVFNGPGYESAFFIRNSPKFYRVANSSLSALPYPTHGKTRSSHISPIACVDAECTPVFNPLGTTCDASHQTCGPCPDCGGPENFADDTVPCFSLIGCSVGDLSGAGVALVFDGDSGVTCSADLASLDLDCYYAEGNKPANVPPRDLTFRYLYNAPIGSWNLFCNAYNVSAFVKVTFADTGGIFNLASFLPGGEQGVWAHRAFVYPEKSSMKAQYYVDTGPKYAAFCQGSS